MKKFTLLILVLSMILMLPLLSLMFMFLAPRGLSEDVLPKDIRDWRASGDLYDVNGHKMFAAFFTPEKKPFDPTQVCIILMHGFPSSSFEFHRVAAQLSAARGSPVLVYDHVGFGFSDKPRVNYPYSIIDQADQSIALWRLLGIRSAQIIAHDMGDTVLTELLGRLHRQELPDYFAKGFFRSTTFTNGGMVYQYINQRVSQQFLKTPVIGPFVQQLILHLDRDALFMKAQLRTIWPAFSSEEVPANENEKIMAEAAGDGESGSPPSFIERREKDINDILLLLQVGNGHHILHLLMRYLYDRSEFEHRWHPAFSSETGPKCNLLWGDQDAVSPMLIPETIHKLSNGRCAVTVMQGAGHFIQLERPAEWLKHINAFLAE